MTINRESASEVAEKAEAPMNGIDQSDAPDATHFRVGDVWMAPGGFLHKVINVKRDGYHRDMIQMATLRAGQDGAGRKSVRRWDAIGARTGRPWTRVSWGGMP